MKKSVVIFLVALMALGAVQAVCASGTTEKAGGPVKLVLPTYKAGQNVGAKFFLPQVKRFNEKYAGVYEIVIEELPQDSYFDKIKQLAQQNKLPALVEGADTQWFEKVMIANNKVFDLKPWLDKTPAVKSTLIDDALAYNTRDGKVVSLPVAVTRPIGLYYNETLYAPAKRVGQMTFDEFAASLGANRIAFMTSENAWTTGLFLTSLIVQEPGGAAMLRAGVTNKIYDYTSPIWVSAVTKLQAFLRDHATANTLGAVYADAANAFMSKNAAVIPNGPWMVNDFAAGSDNKWSGGFSGTQVRGDAYPGNTVISNVLGFGYWIPAATPEPECRAALAFLEFIRTPAEVEAYMLAEGGTAPKLNVSKDFLAKQAENRILNDLATAVNAKTVITASIYDAMPTSVGDVEFGKLLPKLMDGSYTPAQFLAELTKKANETKM